MSSLFQGGPDTNLSYNADSGALGGVGSSQATFQDINPNDINQNNTSGQMTPAQIAQQQQQQEAYANWYNENQSNRQGFQNELNQAANRNAPTMGPTQLNGANFNQDRASQQGFINQLQAQASGQGPSLATQQLKQGQEQSLDQQMAMLGSQRGSTNAATAQRQAGYNAANTMAQTNQSAAQARIQEQLNAQGQLGQALNNMQGQDLSYAGQNAQLSQATNQANLQAYLQNQQMNQQLEGSGLASLAGLNQQDLQSMQTGEQLQNQDYLARMGANVSAAQMGATEQSQAIAAAVSALGSAAAASDETNKELTTSLSPGDQKVLSPDPNSFGAMAGASLPTVSPNAVGNGAATSGQQAGAMQSDPSGDPQLAAALSSASKAGQGGSMGTPYMDHVLSSMTPVSTPRPISFMDQAAAINAVNNGAISLSPGQQKVLVNGASLGQTLASSPALASSPVYRPGMNLNGGGFVPPTALPAMQGMATANNAVPNNGIYIAPSAPVMPTAPATQNGAEKTAMQGGPASQMAFLRSLNGQQGTPNNAMMKDVQGNAAIGNIPQKQTVAPSPVSSPTTSPAALSATQATQAPSSFGQALQSAGSGGGGSVSLAPAVNAPLLQAGPKNIPPNVISVSSDDEKELHTADKASSQEKAINTADAYAHLRDFLDKVDAHQYKYINPDVQGAGDGTYISPMAQELEQSDVGKSMVKPGPDGLKRVDYGKGFGAMLAAQAMHERRLDNVEQGLADALKKRKARS